MSIDSQLAETYRLLGDLLMVEAPTRFGLDEEARRFEELARKAHETARSR